PSQGPSPRQAPTSLVREPCLPLRPKWASLQPDSKGAGGCDVLAASHSPKIEVVCVDAGGSACLPSPPETQRFKRLAELADGSLRHLRGGLLTVRRRLVTIVPPGLRDAARVARFGRGSAKHVPIREPVRGLVPVRNPIAARADHPVEYPAGRRQARAAIGFDDLINERIDDWIGNAGEILRALHCGGLRGKITPQRVAGRARKGEPLNREVEV